MMRLVYVSTCLSLLALPLFGCYGGERRKTGECPAGEACSDLTPRGLDFVGNALVGEILLSGPRPTAIGGTQTVALEYDRGDGIDVALDLPFTADDDGGLGVRVDSIRGSQVIVRGAGSRKNYLRILDEDGLLMDRKELTGAALERIELVAAETEQVATDRPLAFAPGTRRIGVALYGDVQTSSGPRSDRLVDTSMQLALAGAQRKAWDTLELDAVIGTSTLAVTAGDKPTASLDVVVTAQADSVAAMAPLRTTIVPNTTAQMCFEATYGGRYIAGLAWTFVVDGVTKSDGGSVYKNCVNVTTTKTSGTVAVEAHAGGQSTAMALTIGTARELPAAGDNTLGVEPERASTTTRSHAITTAGDRAAM
jgi:hypothetical protein